MHTNPDVLALLALGEQVGSPSEREHVAACPVCTAEVAEFQRLATLGRSTSAEELSSPSPAVWDRITAELGFESARSEDEPPINGATVHRLADQSRATTPSEPPEAPPARAATGGRFLALAGAAAVALIVGVGIGLGWDRLFGPSYTVVAQANLDALPDWEGSFGEARVEQDAQGNRTLVVEVTASRTVAGSEEVWLIDPKVKGMRTLGFLRDGEARLSVPRDFDLRAFPIVDVSAEPNDGVGAHSGDSIVRGTLAL